MLALSTSRQSMKTAEFAIERAKEGKKLIIAFVVDVNLARYFIGAELGLYPELKERCKEELLKEYRDQAAEKISSIVKTAEDYGISVKIYMSTGRFALECLEALRKEDPKLIITTRSKRPNWVKKFSDSPIDYLITSAGCPVLEV